MKKRTFIYLLFLFIISCSHDDDAPSDNPLSKENLLGEWTWVKSIGGMDGVTEHNPKTENYTLQYHFKDNDTVLITKNEKTVDQKTTYRLTEEGSILFNEEHPFLTIDYVFYDDDRAPILLPMRYIIDELNNNHLVLTEDVFDGYSLTLEKE